MASWSNDDFFGPNGEDWRVPVSEMESRIAELSERLADAGIEAALIQNPVDLYYYAGGRQNGAMIVPAANSMASLGEGGDGATFFVRRSVNRAKFEAGGDDMPFQVDNFPSLRNFADKLSSMGLTRAPGL
ncbi:MAG: aminopeptidase P family N-terminal domain-containing protein, partial [Candidatus Thermoplasmatota archaeon]|nr:aminopeptidase P family N-terminal domain-containing protein [Candidatus Thermoplasmatota archaeon]